MDTHEYQAGDLVRITDTSGWAIDWRFASDITWRVISYREHSGFVLEPVVPRELPWGNHLVLSNSPRTRGRIVPI